MEDEKIVELFFSRSEEAVGALSEKYGCLCRKIAANALADERDIEECVNDAYLGVWNAIPPEKPLSLAAFVCRVVKNLALKRAEMNHAEKRKSNYGECIDELKECISGRDSTIQPLETEELSREMNRFLEALDKQNRMLFVRRYWFLDDYTSLSAKSGLKEGAVRTRLSRVRKKLKKYLEKRGMLP